MKKASRVLPQRQTAITTLGHESEVVILRHRAEGRFSKPIVRSHTVGLKVHTGQGKSDQRRHAHEVSTPSLRTLLVLVSAWVSRGEGQRPG